VRERAGACDRHCQYPASVLRARLAVVILVAVAVAVAVAAAACAGTVRDQAPTPSGMSRSAAPASPTEEPTATEAAATEEPLPTGPAPTDTPPTDAPVTAAPASGKPPASPMPAATDDASADPSADPGIAAACSGSDANREFYVQSAGAVAWPVYCAVLPSGWFVSTGSYRAAGGGKLEISYRGPSGATMALSEGSFCADATGCVPAGADAGHASFGPRAASLVRLDDGGWAVVADRGARPSWLFVSHSLDQAASVALAAALTGVAD